MNQKQQNALMRKLNDPDVRYVFDAHRAYIDLLTTEIAQLKEEIERLSPSSYTAFFSQGSGGVPGCSCN